MATEEISGWRITQRGDELELRGTVGGIVLGVIFFLVFGFIGFGGVYIGLTYPSTGWHLSGTASGPMRSLGQHSMGDQVATVAFVILFFGTIGVAGIVALCFGLSRFLRPWQFDRRQRTLTRAAGLGRAAKVFPLADYARVAVVTTFGGSGAKIVLQCRDDVDAKGARRLRPLKLTSATAGKNRPIAEVRREVEELADRIRAFVGPLNG